MLEQLDVVVAPFEAGVVAIFTLEYLLRLYSAPADPAYAYITKSPQVWRRSFTVCGWRGAVAASLACTTPTLAELLQRFPALRVTSVPSHGCFNGRVRF